MYSCIQVMALFIRLNFKYTQLSSSADCKPTDDRRVLVLAEQKHWPSHCGELILHIFFWDSGVSRKLASTSGFLSNKSTPRALNLSRIRLQNIVVCLRKFTLFVLNLRVPSKGWMMGRTSRSFFFDLLLKRSFLDRVVDLLKGKTIPHTSAMHQNNVVTQKDSRIFCVLFC